MLTNLYRDKIGNSYLFGMILMRHFFVDKGQSVWKTANDLGIVDLLFTSNKYDPLSVYNKHMFLVFKNNAGTRKLVDDVFAHPDCYLYCEEIYQDELENKDYIVIVLEVHGKDLELFKLIKEQKFSEIDPNLIVGKENCKIAQYVYQVITKSDKLVQALNFSFETTEFSTNNELHRYRNNYNDLNEPRDDKYKLCLDSLPSLPEIVRPKITKAKR